MFMTAAEFTCCEFVVESVMNNSPASEAGILPGDQIVRVGLAPARILQLQNVLKVLQKKPGNKVRLLIFRNGVKIRKTLLLRNLI